MVFEWEGKEITEERIVADIYVLLEKDERVYRKKLAPNYELKFVASRVLESPEGGRDYAWSGNVVRLREWKTTISSFFGYAWTTVGSVLYLSVDYRDEKLPLLRNDFQLTMFNAGKALLRCLLERGLEPSVDEVRIGNLVFGGYPFEMGPRWIAPTEEMSLRMDLKRAAWGDLLEWEHLRLKPPALSRRLSRALTGEEKETNALERALRGEASGIQVLGMDILNAL